MRSSASRTTDRLVDLDIPVSPTTEFEAPMRGAWPRRGRPTDVRLPSRDLKFQILVGTRSGSPSPSLSPYRTRPHPAPVASSTSPSAKQPSLSTGAHDPTVMSNYVSSLTPLRGALAAVGISTSVFFIGNLTHSYFGAVPIIQHADISLDPQQKAKTWAYFYDRAKAVFFGSAVLSTALFAAVAYLHHDSAGRTLAIVGGVSSAVIGPWTASQMMPINDVLASIARGDQNKAPYADKLVERWRQAHNVRQTLGFVAYLCALALSQTA